MKSPSQRRTRGQNHVDAESSMTTMIDVVFLLLIFFVWTSSFDLPDQDLPGPLAVAATSDSAGQSITSRSPMQWSDEILIRIRNADSRPRFIVGSIAINDLDSLQAHMKAIADIGSVPPVIIDPDDLVPFDLVMTTLDRLRDVGCRNVSLASSTETP
ncbi:MAG: biopolymer transporter ExbD [Planctomycetota bacterium]